MAERSATPTVRALTARGVEVRPVVLIGGASHAGKSTVARLLAARSALVLHSTDDLAKHPGRPWPGSSGSAVPAHVAEHYRSLSVAELLADVLDHYGVNVMPAVEGLIDAAAPGGSSATGMVIEGSALWPPFVAELQPRLSISAVWLTIGDDALAERIRSESRAGSANADSRMLIEAFLGRTLAYNRRMNEEIDRLGCDRVKVDGLTPQAVLASVMAALDASVQ